MLPVWIMRHIVTAVLEREGLVPFLSILRQNIWKAHTFSSEIEFTEPKLWLVLKLFQSTQKLRDALQGWRGANQLPSFENMLFQVSFVSVLQSINISQYLAIYLKLLSVSFNISQSIYQYLSISLNISQYLSIYLNIYQYLSTSINIYQYLGTSIHISQYLLIYLYISQHISISLNISQYL